MTASSRRDAAEDTLASDGHCQERQRQDAKDSSRIRLPAEPMRSFHSTGRTSSRRVGNEPEEAFEAALLASRLIM